MSDWLPVAATAPHPDEMALTAGPWVLIVAADGTIHQLTGPGTSALSYEGAFAAPLVVVQGQPAARVGTLQERHVDTAEWVQQYTSPTLPDGMPITLRHHIALASDDTGSVTITLSYTVLQSATGWRDAEILLPVPLAWNDPDARLFVPRQSGRLDRPPAREGLDTVLTISGLIESDPRKRLAVPLVGADHSRQPGKISVAWDPYAMGRLRLGPASQDVGGDHLATPYAEALGPLAGEERSLWCTPKRSARSRGRNGPCGVR